MPRYYQLNKFAKSAKRAAIASLVLPAVMFIIEICVMLNRDISPVPLVASVIELVCSVGILFLAQAAGRGIPAAFFGVLSLSVFALVRTAVFALVGLPYFSCDIVANIPVVYLIYLCIESIPELRQLIRRRREDRQADQRGFPVLPLNQTDPQPFPVPPVKVDEAAPEPILVAVPFQEPPDRSIMSHYMHLAAKNAMWLGALSLFSGICLLLIEYFEASRDRLHAMDLQGVLIFFIAPAALLMICGWRMAHKELWAYLLCTLVAGALFLRILALAFALRFLHDRSAYLPSVFEGVKNVPCIYLLMRCINALRDAFENRRNYRREKEIARQRARGGGLAPELASIAPPPPVGRAAPRRFSNDKSNTL